MREIGPGERGVWGPLVAANNSERSCGGAMAGEDMGEESYSEGRVAAGVV